VTYREESLCSGLLSRLQFRPVIERLCYHKTEQALRANIWFPDGSSTKNLLLYILNHCIHTYCKDIVVILCNLPLGYETTQYEVHYSTLQYTRMAASHHGCYFHRPNVAYIEKHRSRVNGCQYTALR